MLQKTLRYAMRTFILEWNPDTSSMSETTFSSLFRCMEWGDIFFRLRKETTARSGDNFYLATAGTISDGIVGKGFFLSDPRALDSSDDRACRISARPTFLVAMDNPRGILTTERLKSALPGVPFGEPDTCRELPDDAAARLDALWDDYATRFTEGDFECGIAERIRRPVAGIDEAVSLAAEAHYDQMDLDGNPVILHPLAVGLSGKTDDERICGFLHDVLEDTDWTPGRIRDKGFSEHIVDTLVLLTHECGVPYMDYVKRIVESGNPTALAVKVNDLRNNLERGRARGHDGLVKKHTEALDYITKASIQIKNRRMEGKVAALVDPFRPWHKK